MQVLFCGWLLWVSNPQYILYGASSEKMPSMFSFFYLTLN